MGDSNEPSSSYDFLVHGDVPTDLSHGETGEADFLSDSPGSHSGDFVAVPNLLTTTFHLQRDPQVLPGAFPQSSQ